MTIECYDIHHDEPAGTVFDVSMWYCPTTCVGNETNPAAWTLISTTVGVSSAGQGAPTFVDMSGNGVVFSAGQSYGIYVTLAVGTDIDYTNGGPTTFLGDHCDLTTQYGNSINWGGFFSPREWNGVLYTELAGPAGPTLTVVGQCGMAGSGVQATNMTPNGPVGFAASPNATGATVPGGPCGPVQVDLAPPLFVIGVIVADGTGTATLLPGNGIPAVACGWTMQSLDFGTCTTTNSVVL